jgi:quercetin dioxygenase-like cupin family protein
MLNRRSLVVGAAAAVFATKAQATRPEIIHETIAEAPDATRGSKVLTIDPVTKATTAYYTIRENWVGSGRAHYHSSYEEVFVLDGDVTLTGTDYYVKGSYLYRPGGIVHGHHEGSRLGTRMITRTGAAIDFNYVDNPVSEQEYVLVPNTADGRPHILHLRTPSMKAESLGSGAAHYTRKLLSRDVKTGASTSLLEFPSAFTGRIALAPKMNHEWIVTAGQAMLDDGTVYELESFSFRPAGLSRAFVSAAPNTQILLWEEP